jgi:hypothetical protein
LMPPAFCVLEFFDQLTSLYLPVPREITSYQCHPLATSDPAETLKQSVAEFSWERPRLWEIPSLVPLANRKSASRLRT